MNNLIALVGATVYAIPMTACMLDDPSDPAYVASGELGVADAIVAPEDLGDLPDLCDHLRNQFDLLAQYSARYRLNDHSHKGSGATIHGTSGPDLIFGTPYADQIFGEGGDDIICAGSGNDFVDGGLGQEALMEV
jgi:Ca2+-binding RTX toxin-like protein